MRRFRLVRQCTVQIENIRIWRSFEDAFETIPIHCSTEKDFAVSCDFINVIFVCLFYDFFSTKVKHIVDQICNEVKCTVKVRLVRETMFYKKSFYKCNTLFHFIVMYVMINLFIQMLLQS